MAPRCSRRLLPARCSPRRIGRAAVRVWLHPREESGAVLVLVAMSMVMIIGAVSLSLDIGQQVDRTRNMQAVADAVALDTAQYLAGDTAAEYVANSDPSGAMPWTVAQTESVASAQRNAFEIAGNGGPATNFLTLTAGIFDPSTTPTFTPVVSTDPSVLDQAQSGQIVNAVQVTASSNQKFTFATGNSQVARVATAMRTIPDSNCIGCAPAVPSGAISGFTIGSFLVNLNTQKSVLNGLLSPLGTNLNLTAVGYQGLVSSSITLAGLVAADPSLGTVDHLLSTKFPPKTLLSGVGAAIGAQIAQLTSSGSQVPAGLLQAQTDIDAIAGGMFLGTPISMCQLLDPSGVGPNCAPNQAATLGVMNLAQLVTGIIELANGSSALNLGGGIGGLASLTVSVIQPPQMALPGPINVTKAHTAQVTLDATLNVLDVGTVDANVTVASAVGTLTSINCATPPTNSSTTVHVDTQGANLAVSLIVLGAKVPLTSIPILGVSQDLSFPGPWSAVPQSNFYVNPNSQTTNDASFTGLGAQLFNALEPVLAALGVNLAGATVSNSVLDCGVPVLVKTA